MDRRRGRPKQQRRVAPGVPNLAVIKPLPTGGAPTPSSSGATSGASSPDDHSGATSTSTTATSNHFMHSPPPAPSYAQPMPTSVSYGLGLGLDGAMGSPLARGSSGVGGGVGGGGGGGGATAANASDLLLSFLTQTVREMKEKITSLEDDNQHLRTKHRKLKRRLKDNDERVEQLFSTVANLAQAQAQAPHPQHQQQRVQSMPTARSHLYASTLSSSASSSSTLQPLTSKSPPSSSSSPTSSSASSSSSAYDSYYAYPLPTATTSATPRLALSHHHQHQQHQQMPLQDFLDRSLATENAASAVSYGSGGGGGSSGGGQSTSALHNHQRAALLQQYQHHRQQMQQQSQQQQQQYPGAGDLSSTVSGYAAPPGFSMTAGFQQQQQQQQQPAAAAAAAAAAMRMMMEPGPVCGVPGLGVPSYTLNSVSDIKRHFPYFDECYFDKAHFVVNDLRKPYLVMQFVSMDSTVVTASEAYCSLSGFTLHEVCHTKKLVALLPRSYKKRMIPLFVHNNEPNSTTILETAGQLVRKDGQIVSLDYQMQFFFDAQGKVKWLCASIEKMVGVDKSFVYNNAYDSHNDEERIKLLRDRLRDQEKQEWDELIHEYLRSTASVPVLALTPCLASGDIAATHQQQQPSSNPASSTSSSSSSSATSSLTQQDLPSSSSSSSSASLRAGGLSTASSSGINSPPVSPLSPMTTSWLAEMLATPPSTSSSSSAANNTTSDMGYD